MNEHVKRFISMIFESLIASVMRLARVAAIRAELESYTELFEEARSLEQGGQTRLARHLRSEMDAILNGSSLPAAGPALNGDHGPFALESEAKPLPSPLERGALNEAEAGGDPPRRRGRRPRASKESDTSMTAMNNGEAKVAAEASAEFPQQADLMSKCEESPAESEVTAEQPEPRAPLDMNSEECF